MRLETLCILPRDVMELVRNRGLSKMEAVETLLQQLPSATTSSLSLSKLGLEYIPSLEHFIHLKNLEITSNQLRELPKMPEGLRRLQCSTNLLTSLRNIPSTVLTIIADKNEIVSLDGLPPGLTGLSISFNRIEHLEALPPDLEMCYVGFNRLQRLPPLPATLRILSCLNNDLIDLPRSLPLSLHALLCDSNPRLSSLPPLPPSLIRLSLRHCNISRIPRLPDRIICLDVSHSPVFQMENLPPSLVDPRDIMDAPIGAILHPTFTTDMKCTELIELRRSNLQKLNRFRELYYTLKYKSRFWDLLWVKVRMPKIERANHPDLLQEALEQDGEESELDLEVVLQNLGKRPRIGY